MARHQVTRVRHETRRRMLTVEIVEQLTPRMRRITFRSPELHDFVSAAADDHIKLFFSPETGGDARPVMRDFTPRRFDPNEGTLVIDFALHDAGPATQWAAAARVGDTLEIGGPRGSAIIPDDFGWYLLIGDETALPAIGRRVEESRRGVPIITVVVVESPEEHQAFRTDAAWTPVWVIRDGTHDDADLIREALSTLQLPEGEGGVWIAAETNVARALRRYMVEARDHPQEWLKAAGYWTKGEADTQERIAA